MTGRGVYEGWCGEGVGGVGVDEGWVRQVVTSVSYVCVCAASAKMSAARVSALVGLVAACGARQADAGVEQQQSVGGAVTAEGQRAVVCWLVKSELWVGRSSAVLQAVATHLLAALNALYSLAALDSLPHAPKAHVHPLAAAGGALPALLEFVHSVFGGGGESGGGWAEEEAVGASNSSSSTRGGCAQLLQRRRGAVRASTQQERDTLLHTLVCACARACGLGALLPLAQTAGMQFTCFTVTNSDSKLHACRRPLSPRSIALLVQKYKC